MGPESVTSGAQRLVRTFSQGAVILTPSLEPSSNRGTDRGSPFLPSTLRLTLPGVPVLTYHGLTGRLIPPIPPSERRYWVGEGHFRDQLKFLRLHGYRTSGLEEVVDPDSGRAHSGRPVVLTFDDGRSSDYQVAFPQLLEAEARAVFFLNTARIGAPGFLSWAEIAEMQRAGMSFQSHGHDHVDMSRLSPRTLEKQLNDSKRRLEEGLGQRVDFLAVPYGRLNHQVVKVALRVGFRAVCSTRCLPARPGRTTITRVLVYRDTDLAQFHQLVTGNLLRYAARTAGALLLYAPRHLVVRLWPNKRGVRVLEEGG